MSESDPFRAGPSRENPYPAEKARQGEIVLTHKSTRWIFFAGLVGFVALALVLAVWGR